MRRFLLHYLLPRIAQFLTIIFVGITVTFIIPRLTPTDPVEAQISMMLARGNLLDPASRCFDARISDRNVRAFRQPRPAIFRILGKVTPRRPRPFALQLSYTGNRDDWPGDAVDPGPDVIRGDHLVDLWQPVWRSI